MPSNKFLRSLALATVAGVGLLGLGQAQAALLTISNAACSAFISPPSQGAVEADFKAKCAPGETLTQLYKSDYGSSGVHGESGPYASYYETDFSGDPNNANIVWVGPESIGGFDKLYVLAKDGNHNPSYYGWVISGWNGTDTIALSGLWMDKGAISNVSIWGVPGAVVPEPGPIGLLGLGLVALYMARRRIGAR